MSCIYVEPKYVPHSEGGLTIAVSRGDGYTIALQWDRAFPSIEGNSVAYNIYYSSVKEDVFDEGVKFVIISTGALADGYLTAEITELTPGEMYYFAVRAFEYTPSVYNLNLLPKAANGYTIYPETILSSDISEVDTIIPITDINLFPDNGVIQIGTELIRYRSKDTLNSSLILGSVLTDRGYLGTNVRYHQINGYDGVTTQSPIISFWKGFEEKNDIIQQETASFHYPNYAYTSTDGYSNVTTDIVTTDLSSTDANNDFPAYDYAGWHRTDPSLLLMGGCLDTYIGGELYCADSSLGVGRQLRGISINEQSNQRLEILLNETGVPCVLLRRQHTGVRCSCYLSTVEYPEHRCPLCFGVGFVLGYSQYFNSRRSDGRIMVRFGTYTDDVKMGNAGLESEIITDCWTLVTPIIKDRDVILKFNDDGTREFYYEVLDVARNYLFEGEYGSQKFRAQRVRKTDKIYQMLVIDSTATIPEVVSTSIGFMQGSGSPIPHIHEIRINESVTDISQIRQTTSISYGHNHQVRDGVVLPILGHTHTIVLP